MKKNLKFYFCLSFLFIMGPTIFGQDFTVKVSETDDYGGFITPLKPSAQKTLSISVKNNSIDPKCDVFIDRTAMGEV